MKNFNKNQIRKINYDHAYEEMHKHIGKPLTHELVLILHACIMGIKFEQSSYRTGCGAPPIYKNFQASYLPPDSGINSMHQEVTKLLFWYAAEIKTSPSINEIAARFHWGFVKIHPFDDGNGRTARLLVAFILLSHSYSDDECINFINKLSTPIEKYYDALDDGNFLYPGFDKVSQKWLLHFNEAYKQSISNDGTAGKVGQ